MCTESAVIVLYSRCLILYFHAIARHCPTITTKPQAEFARDSDRTIFSGYFKDREMGELGKLSYLINLIEFVVYRDLINVHPRYSRPSSAVKLNTKWRGGYNLSVTRCMNRNNKTAAAQEEERKFVKFKDIRAKEVSFLLSSTRFAPPAHQNDAGNSSKRTSSFRGA